MKMLLRRLWGVRQSIGIVLLAVLIRLLLMPFSLHVDPRFVGDVVAMNNYAYLATSDPTRLPVAPLYPMPAYYLMRFFQLVLSPFSPPVTALVNPADTVANWASSPFVFRHLFLFKVWYLIFDLGAVYLLWRMFRHDRGKARLVSLFWLFNPVIIYGAYLHGQFDIVPAFFTVLALYCAQQKRPALVAFFIGIAASCKNYAFLFLLPAALVLTKSWRGRLRLLLVGTVPYLLLVLPYLLLYRESVSRYEDLFFSVGYSTGSGEQVYVFFALYAVLLWYLYCNWSDSFAPVEALWRICLVVLLVYYQLSGFDLHYWVWVIPFAVLHWVERPQQARPFYLAIGLCLLALLAPTPLARFLAPVSPHFFLRLPSLLEALSPYLPIMFIVNVVRSLLAGTCFYLAWSLVRDIPTSPDQALGAGSSPANVS